MSVDRVERVTVLQRLCLFQQQLDEAIGDFGLHQHPLDSGAALSGVLVRAAGCECCGFFEIGVFHHDDRVVTAELQHLPFVNGLAQQSPCRRRRRR